MSKYSGPRALWLSAASGALLLACLFAVGIFRRSEPKPPPHRAPEQVQAPVEGQIPEAIVKAASRPLAPSKRPPTTPWPAKASPRDPNLPPSLVDSDAVRSHREDRVRRSFDADGIKLSTPEGKLAFALQEIRIGGQPLPLGSNVLKVEARPMLEAKSESYEYARGAVVERYVVRGAAVEQIFELGKGLEALRGGGDLTVRVALSTDLRPAQVSKEVELDPAEPTDRLAFYRGEAEVFSYGGATAIDAAGRRRALKYKLQDGVLEMTLDKAFLAEAVFPLTIDPLIGSYIFVDTAVSLDRKPDIAFNNGPGLYLAVYERQLAGPPVHGDIYCRTILADGTISGQAVIDTSTFDARNPKVARASGNRFLVVWQEKNVGGFFQIMGMYVNLSGTNPSPSGTKLPLYALAPTIDQTVPDVGFCIDNTSNLIAWEYAYGAGDHDIYSTTIDAASTIGALRIIDGSGNWEETPAVTPVSSNPMGVVYTKRTSAGAQGDIWARSFDMLSAGTNLSGQVIVGADPKDDSQPEVASAAGMSFCYATWTNQGSASNLDNLGRRITFPTFVSPAAPPTPVLGSLFSIDPSGSTSQTRMAMTVSGAYSRIVFTYTFNPTNPPTAGASDIMAIVCDPGADIPLPIETPMLLNVTSLFTTTDEIESSIAINPGLLQAQVLYNRVLGVSDTDIYGQRMQIGPKPGVTVTPTSGLVVSESGGTPATFTVVLDSQPTANVTIPIASLTPSEGAAAPTSLTFTTLNWNTAQTVTVTGVNDSITDGAQSFFVQVGDPVSGDPGYAGLTDLDTADVSVTNLDNEPEVSIVATDAAASEPGVDKGLFTVTRTGATTAALTVNYTVGGTATSGTDYTAIGTSVVIPIGAVSTTIQVSPIDDNIAEPAETVIVTLSASANYTITGSGNATVTITDNEVAGVAVSGISGNTSENFGFATFTVVLTSQPVAGSTVTIPIVSLTPSEGTALPASLVFNPSNWSTAQTVTVTGANDTVTDGTKQYTIQVGDPSSPGDPAYNALTDASTADVTVFNLDNEPEVTMTVSGANADEATLNDGKITFTRTGDITGNLTVNYSIGGTATNGVDYVAIGTSVVIPIGSFSTSVSITPIDDFIAEGTETVILTLATGFYTIKTTGPATVNILDNDVAGVTVSGISGHTKEDGTPAFFTVVLNTQPTGDVTIPIQSLNTAEGTVSTSSLFFKFPNDWNTAQTVTVTGVNDSITDGNFPYTIKVGDPSSPTDSFYNNLTDLDTADVPVINDDNEPEVSLTVSDSSASEPGVNTGSFTVTRTGSIAAALTVNFSVGGTATSGVDYTSIGTSVVIPIGQASAVVTVTPLDDLIVEPTETVILTLTPTAPYTIVGTPTGTVNILDNDVAGFTVSGISGHTSENLTPATFTVVLTSQPAAPVSIPILSLTLTEGTAAPATLNFSTLNWNTAQTVTVTGVNDTVTDPARAYFVQVGPPTGDAAYVALAAQNVPVTNDDNEPELTITVPDATATEGNAGADTGRFRFSRTGSTTTALTVNYSISGTATNGTDYVTLSGSASIPVGAAFVDVTITTIDNSIAEPTKTVILTMASGFYTPIAPLFGQVDVVDDDAAGVLVNLITPATTTESLGTAKFTVALKSQPTASVTIPIVSQAPAEGTVSTPSLIFTTSNWSTAQTVTVTGVNDTVTDALASTPYVVKVGDPTSADPAYEALTDADTSDVNLTNLDNEPEVSLSVTDGVAAEPADSGTFTVTRTGSLAAALSVSYSISGTATNGVDYTTLSGTVVIPIGAASAPIVVSPTDDAVAEGPETVIITLTPAAPYTVIGAAQSITIADNDIVSVFVSPISRNTNENLQNAFFTVVLTSKPSADVTIPIQSQNTGEGTVSTSSLTFTTASWNTAQTVTVTGVNDSVTDAIHAYSVKVGDPSSLDAAYNALTDADTQDVAVINDDNEPEVSILATDAAASEAGLDPGTFTVTRTGDLTAALVVNYTIGGTATNGTDYVTLTGSVTIPIGASFATITVTPIQDAIAEVAETVSLTLTSSVNYTIVSGGPATVTIADNDNVGISVSAISGNTSEGGNPATFTVVLTSQPAGAVAVPILSLTPTEGTAAPATLNFSTLNWNTAQTVTVTGVNDSVTDPAHVYFVQVGQSTGDAAYAALLSQNVSVTNDDNEPEVSLALTDGAASEAGLDPGSLTVTRTGSTGAALVVNYTIGGTATNGSDYSSLSGSVTIPAALFSATITVTPIQDLIAEGPETVIITLAAGSYTIAAGGPQTVTIADNDSAAVVATAPLGHTTEDLGPTTFTVKLNSQPTASVSMTVLSQNTLEGTALPASLTFTTSNWSTAQTVTVTGVNDSITDPIAPTPYVVRLGVPTGDAAYAALAVTDVPLLNDDNEPEITVVVTDGAATEAAGNTGLFTLTRTGATTAALAVTYSISGTATNGTDYTSLSGTATFAIGSPTATITVSPIEDSIAEGSETVSITLVAGGYTIKSPGTFTVTITDNDNAGFTVSPASNNTSENLTPATFTVVLNTQPTATITVPIASLDTTEGTVSTASLVFTTTNWNTAQTVTVTGVNDTITDPIQGYFVQVGPPTGDPGYAVLLSQNVSLINDDNEPEVTLVATDPTATEGTPTTDTGTFTVTRTGNTTAALTVNYTVGGSATNGTDYTAIGTSVVIPIGASSATITVIPTDDANLEPAGETVVLTLAGGSYTVASATPSTVTIVDNDAAGISVSAISNHTSENLGTATFTVVLNTVPTGPVTVQIASQDALEGTASTSNLLFSVVNWNTPQTVTVTGVNDSVIDPAHAYNIQVGPASGDAAYAALANQNVAVINDDNDPEITLVVADAAASEAGLDPGSFTVSRNTGTVGTVTVNYSIGGTATNGTDYATLSGSVTISPGSSSATITVTPIQDLVAEGPETVAITLQSSANYKILTPGAFTVTIADNDSAAVVATAPLGHTTEDLGPTTFTVKLNSQPTASVSMTVLSQNTAEGTALPGSLTFTTSNWSTAQTVTVTGVNDSITDPIAPTPYVVRLGVPTGDAAYAALAVTDVPLLNDDNEPEITIAATDAAAAEAGSDPGTFTLTRTGDSTATLVVNYTIGGTATNGTDYTLLSGSVTFAALSNTATITVTPVDDALVEGAETVTVTLVPGAYTRITLTPVTVTIADNDSASVVVNLITPAQTTENAGTAKFTVVLGSQPTADVTIPISSSKTGEGTVSTSTLTFTGLNWNTAQTVTVTGVNDTITDVDTPYTVVVGDPSSLDAAYDALTDANTPDVLLINVDNEPEVTITATDPTATEGTPATDTGTFTVTRTGNVSAALTVNFTVTGTATSGTDYTAIGTSVVIPIGASSATITVTPVDDALVEAPETVLVTLTSSGSYTIMGGGLATVTIADNDSAALVLTPISGHTTEGGGPATFTVALNSQPTATVSMTVSSLVLTEGTVAPASLSFTTVNWSAPQTVTVTGVNDSVTDVGTTYTVQLGIPSGDAGYTALGVKNITVTNDDNEPEVTIVATDATATEGTPITDTGTFTVTRTGNIGATLTVNYTIGGTATNGTDYTTLSGVVTIAAGSPTATITVTPIDDALVEPSESVLLTLVPSINYTIMAGGTATVNIADNDNASLTVVASPTHTTESAGTSSFTVALNSQPSASVSMSVTSLNTAEGNVSTPSLTFTTTNWNTAQTVTVTGVNDTVTDALASTPYSVRLGVPTGDPAYAALPVTDVGFLNDDNEPEITLTVSDPTASEPGIDTGSFLVTRTGSTVASLTVNFSVTGTATSATDYTSIGTSVVIPAGASSATITVTPIDDAVVEVPETVIVTLVSSVTYTIVGGGPATVTIADNDIAGVTVFPSSGLTTTESGGPATFTVVLTSKPSADVTIPIQSQNVLEGTASPSTLTFTTATWNTAQTVTVTGVNDTATDGNVSYIVKVGDPSSLDPIYNALTDVDTQDVTVVNNDNEPELTLVATDNAASETGPDTATFTISRSGSTGTAVTVNYSIGGTATNGTDYTALSGVVTIAASSLTATIVVTPIDDAIVEGPETVVVTLTSSSIGTIVSGGPATATISDNDNAGLTVVASPAHTTEGAGTSTFTVVLNTQPGASVQMTVLSQNTAEGTALPALLTFTTTNWNTAQTVTVTGVNDTVTDALASTPYVVRLGVPTGDAAYATLPVTDVPFLNDDNEPEISLTVSDPSAAESPLDTGSFTVTRTGSTAAALTVNFTVGGTATSGVDYVALGTSVVIPAGQSSAIITVTPIDDFIPDAAETVILNVAAGSYTITSGGPGTVTITDNDAVGVIVSAISGPTTESGGTATFTVVLNSQPTASVAIPISSLNTAEGTVSVSSLTFTPTSWNTAQTVTVTGVNDTVTDGNATFTVKVGDPSSLDPAYNLLTDVDTADVTVTNNDNEPEVTLAATDATASEPGADTGTFTITRTGSTGTALTVNFTVSGTATNGTDYAAIGTSVVIPASALFATVTVTPIDDFVAEGAETVVLTLAPGPYTLLAPTPATVTINDNDAAGVFVGAPSGPTTESGGTATFTVVLTSQPSADVAIPIASLNSSEGTVSTSSLVFTNGNWSTAQTVTVTGANDTVTDGDVSFIVKVGDPSSADPAYEALTDANTLDVTFLNVDNEPELSIVATAPTAAEAGTTPGTFTVSRTGSTAAALGVNYTIGGTATNSVDYATLSGLLTIPAGAASATITVLPVDDAIVDPAETVIVTLAPGGYTLTNPGPATVTIVDNDVVGITVSPTLGLQTSEAGLTAAFTVVLNSAPTATVTINVTSSDPAEGTVSTGILTFTTANAQIPQTVIVTGVDDFIADGDKAYTIVLAPAVSGDPNYNGVDPADVSITNRDNDVTGVTVTPTTGLITNEFGKPATFTIVLNTIPTADVTIDLSSSDTTEGTVSPIQVVFTTANWNTAQTVTVTGVDDALNDGNITYTIVTAPATSADASYNNFNPPDVTVLNVDNETPAITVTPLTPLITTEAGGTATFSMVLNTAPTANVTISLTNTAPGEGQFSATSLVFTTANFQTPQTVTITGVDDALSDGDITYTVVTSPAVSADPQYNGLNPPDITVTNLDDEPFVPPKIAISAIGMAFTASEGGNNPSSQSMFITNNGNGTLNWTLTVDQPWLTVTPTSGSVINGVQQFMTVSVDITGLLANNYSANILFTDPAASNSPQNFLVTLTLLPPPPSPTISVPASDPFTTGTSTVLISGTSSPGSTSVTWVNTTTGESGIATGTDAWATSVPLTGGDNVIRIYSWNAGGAGSSSITVHFSTDAVPPTVAITFPTTAPSYIAAATPSTIAGTASDTDGTVSMPLAGVTWTNLTTGATGAASGLSSWIASIPLTSGSNDVQVTARDLAGNTASQNVIIEYASPPDSGPPVIAVLVPNTVFFASNVTPLAVAGTAADSVGIARVTWYNQTTGGRGIASGTGNWSANIPLAGGNNFVSVSAEDPSGNTTTATLFVSYTSSGGDVVSPFLSIDAPTTLPVLNTGATPIFIAGQAADDVALNTVVWQNPATGMSGTTNGLATWNATMDLKQGANLITMTAYDTSGNKTSQVLAVSYTPPPPPPPPPVHIPAGNCGLTGLEFLVSLGLLWGARRRARKGASR